MQIQGFAIRWLGVAVACFVALPAMGQSTGSVTINGVDYPVVLRDNLTSADFRPLPPGVTARRDATNSSGDLIVTGLGGVEVYRNITGTVFAPVGAGAMIADDIQVVSAGGCPMNLINFAVYGGRQPGAPVGPGFSVTQAAIFDGCPGAGGTMVLDLLNGTPRNLPDDGFHIVEFDLTGVEELIPEQFWFGIVLSSNEAGWVGGSPAAIGFTLDLLDVPGFPCSAVFTDPLLYAGMDLNVFCTTATPFFVGYQSGTSSQFFFGGDGCLSGDLGGCGDGVDVQIPCEAGADDIAPIVPDCLLHSYTVMTAGIDGLGNPAPYNIEFELWTDDNGIPGQPIPNTTGCFTGVGDGSLEAAKFIFDGTTVLPPNFWLVFSDDEANAGPIEAANPAEIGFSEDLFALYNNGWDPGFFFGGCQDGDEDACGSFLVTINCLGEEPAGACCNDLSGACTDGVFVRECSGRWLANVTCAEANFVPPCGTSACCKVVGDPGSETTECEDLLPDDCLAQGGDLRVGEACQSIECGLPACVNAEGACDQGNGSPGCSDPDCCNLVCGADSFCCDTEWDSQCAGIALNICGAPPIPNNFCFDKLPVMLGQTNFDTIGATTDGTALPPECDEGTGTDIFNDIWYNFIPSECGTLTASLCTNTDYDARMAIYEGCTCPPTQVVGCDDDGCGTVGGPSLITTEVTAGTCYTIRIGGFATADFGTGTLDLSIEGRTCCPDGEVTFVDPPDGVVDAREPHDVNNAVPRTGISVLTVNAPAGAPASCFELCETVVEGTPNGIANVVEAPAGTYTITLLRPITMGAVTTLTYHGATQPPVIGTYTSHPGNVNGDSATSSGDIIAIVNCLNGVNLTTSCPWGFPYSQDVDFSGAMAAPDILGVVDLLNGAGAFDPQNNSPLPSPAGCLPVEP